jgi:hypothetical protein
MTVGEAIELLKQCDLDAKLVANLAFQGFEEITSIERKALGGLGRRMSFETVAVVELSNGNVPHMRNNGLDVLGVQKDKG